MDSCCADKGTELAALRGRQSRVLKAVLAVNAVMFLVEGVAGLAAGSTALMADALDMFGDASVYALTLFVLERGAAWRARAVVFKGSVMALFGLAVLGEAIWKMTAGSVPAANAMGLVGALALMANLFCLALLMRHRSDDLNMRSTWLCSRNDILANLGVLLAAAAVAVVHSGWPDIIVGALIAVLFLRSAVSVLRAGIEELHGASTSEP